MTTDTNRTCYATSGRCEVCGRETMATDGRVQWCMTCVPDEVDHYYNCATCGESVDMRVLADVIYHERDGHGRMGRES